MPYSFVVSPSQNHVVLPHSLLDEACHINLLRTVPSRSLCMMGVNPQCSKTKECKRQLLRFLHIQCQQTIPSYGKGPRSGHALCKGQEGNCTIGIIMTSKPSSGTPSGVPQTILYSTKKHQTSLCTITVPHDQVVERCNAHVTTRYNGFPNGAKIVLGKLQQIPEALEDG
jgi:hypothetical protein